MSMLNGENYLIKNNYSIEPNIPCLIIIASGLISTFYIVRHPETLENIESYIHKMFKR